jgi:hypothetical protein
VSCRIPLAVIHQRRQVEVQPVALPLTRHQLVALGDERRAVGVILGGQPAALGAHRSDLVEEAVVRAGAGVAVADRAGLRRGPVEQGGRSAGAGGAAHGRQVAAPVRRGALRRVGRRPTAGPARVGDRRAGRGRGGGHAGIGPGQRHALVAQIDGRTLRAIQVHDRSNLEGLRAAAPSQRGLQAVQ